METGKELHRYENLKPFIVRSVRFSPDSKSLVFACLYSLAIQCEAATGKEERRFVGARSWVWEAAFTPDSRLVVTTSGYDNKRGDGWVVDDGTVRVHDAATGALRATLSGHKRVPGQLSMSPDSRHALVTDQGGTVIEWDLPNPPR
jgi:WD40 repeat protein